MKALVLEKEKKLSLRDFDIREEMGPDDVRIALRSVGICGSDVHYYMHGGIGPFRVREPMILGHEASGVVEEVGERVAGLRPGDRVCMEPGVPNPRSRASRLGMYNLDPEVRFWATPPIHGVMRPTVVHPADFTFKLPDNVSFAEGAMVEPLAVGMHAASKAALAPGDLAVVIGAGTIGLMTIMAALAGGCSNVVAIDVARPRLDIASALGPVRVVEAGRENPAKVVDELTAGWGADVVFEASGSPDVSGRALDMLRPGGRLVYVGMPVAPISFDIVKAQSKEISMSTIFRYANVYPRALALMGAGKIKLLPLVTETYPFDRSIEAYDYAVSPRPGSVKIQIQMA
jgi:D-xylulose reductase